MNCKKLILLVNLGAPETLALGSIRRFLRRFLSDKRVVPLTRLIWYPILFLIILPLRSKKLLHKYSLIWRQDDSHPLVYYTQQQAKLLEQQLASADVIVDYAFCYGLRPIAERLAVHAPAKIEHLTVIPLYPQYSSTTSASVFDQLSDYYKAVKDIPNLKICHGFATHPDYLNAIATQIKNHWQQHGVGQHLLVSFHSIPVAVIDDGDCYFEECQASFAGINEHLRDYGVASQMVFQSKFGKAQWLEPATDREIIRLANSGVKILDVICPGFVSDCLETLEEVAISYRDLFIKHGGQELRYIPCPNDSKEFINVLAKLSS